MDNQNITQSPSIELKSEGQGSRRKLLVILLIATIAGATFLFYNFFGDKIILDESRINSTEFGFSIDYPDNWTASESRFINRIDDDEFVVADNIADCGFDCAVTYKTVIKGGDNYFTIRIFGNKARTPLDTYLKALLKDVRKNTFQEAVTEGGINGWKEEIKFGDGREAVNFYYTKADFIYWINKDILADNEQEFNQLSNEIDLIIGTFKI